MRLRVLVVLLAAALWFGAAGIVSAHAKIDHCTPAPGSTVAAAPAQVVCVMTEEIDTKQSTMSVWDANGRQVDKKDAHVDLNDPDHKTLIVSLDTTLVTAGTYTTKYHTVTPDDNGVTDDSFQFTVAGAPAAVAATETPAATPTTTLDYASGTPTRPALAPSTAPTTGGRISRSAIIDLALLVAFSLITVGLLMQRQTR